MLSLDDAIALVEKKLGKISFPEKPSGLYDPIRYILSNGGKRIRPALVILSSNLFNESVEAAISPAIGIEIFHNFTLLHDDLMDKSGIRRGKPTVHKKWNPDVAILAGDAMCMLAHHFISSGNKKYLSEIVNTYNRMAIEVCEGQMMDMEFESREDVSVDEYLKMIELKTSVLIAASMKIGALVNGASEKDSDALYDFGRNLGLAFQLQDDYLDTYGDVDSFGKKIGNDIITNKKTFLMISALNRAKGKTLETLKSLISENTIKPGEKINQVMGIYNECEIRQLTLSTINEYFNLSSGSLDLLEVEEEKKQALREFSSWLMGRGK